MALQPAPPQSPLCPALLARYWFQGPICSLLRLCPIRGACGAQGQGGNSCVPSKYRSLRALAHGHGGCMALPRAEGTETNLGTQVQALPRLLPKEDNLNSLKWLLPQICARGAEAAVAVAVTALPGEPGLHFHACPHTRPCTRTHILTHTQLDCQVDCSVV